MLQRGYCKMSLRNGKVKSDIPPPKRQYNKAKQQAKPQEEPSDDESITLALEESFENIAVSEIVARVEIETRDESEDNLTLDEYDRPIPRDNPQFYDSIDREIEARDEILEQEVKNKSRKGMNKPSIYKPISERDYVFQSGNIILNKMI